MRPAVLVLGGLDPSGGAGLQADIQTLTALDCHPLPVATCLTVQDGVRCFAAEPVSADLLAQQIVALETHFRIRAIKLGVPGRVLSQKVLEVLPEQVPLIVDPVLSAGGGGELASSSDRYWPQLLARTTLLTPNPSEALKLAEAHSVEAAAARLLGMGVAHVLVTGGDAPTEQVINTLYGPVSARWTLDRFQGRYRGTGCTLASAIAAGLAHGKTLPDSIEAAQRWVSRSLEGATPLTPEVWLPDRRPGI